MQWFRLMILAAVAGQLALNGADADRAAADGGSAVAVAKLPPVLRPTEPPDSRQITLPGPPRVVPALKRITPVAPVAKALPSTTLILEDYALRQPIVVPGMSPAMRASLTVPAVAAVTPATPAKEFALLCQKQIGKWQEADARSLLGEPVRQRPAYDEKKAVNGKILAFKDPSNKYKELELDFDSKSGHLRTVFVYPPRLTWQECRRQWNGPITAADAAQGRKFYSYTNRRLDVLVDPSGHVISLGWY
ncbi:MAG: hypothetical protein ABI806_03420 [Candidatus Solibacter sp.]